MIQRKENILIKKNFPTFFSTEPLLVVSLHSGSDVQKKKRRSLKDFRLILAGWVVGFEPTTFRTTI